jgi:hypothetical protein
MIIHMTCTRMLPSPTSPTSLTGERGLLRRRWQRRITSGALRQAGVGPLHIRDQSHYPPPPCTRTRAHAGQPRKHRLACRQEAAAIHRRVEMTLSRHGRDWAALTAARRLRMVGMSAVLALHSSIRAVFPSAVTSCGWSAWHVSRQAGRHNHAPCPSFTSHGASIRQARGPPFCSAFHSNKQSA